MTATSATGGLSDLLALLLLLGPTTAVLLTCRHLNRRDAAHDRATRDGVMASRHR
jgi:hypothetical protein